MSIKVKFDTILGRLREKDGSETPVTHTFTATTTGSNKSYIADVQETDSLTVTVALRYDGNLVDANTVPSGWTRTALGTYQRTVTGSGTVPATAFTYTPQGGSAMTATSQARTLTKVWPAYWGTYPSGTVPSGRIDTIAANLAKQHRETANVVNRVVNVADSPTDDVWFWVVTHGSASVVDANFGLSIMESPVSVVPFASPMPDVSIDLPDYKVYVATWPAEAGQGGYGDLKINITL